MPVAVGRSAGLSDTGRKRRQNEDAYVCEPPLFAIAAFAWRRARPQDNTLFVVAAGGVFGLVRSLLR